MKIEAMPMLLAGEYLPKVVASKQLWTRAICTGDSA